MESNLIERIEKEGIIPVVKIDDLNDVIPLMNALINGGITAVEITFRTSVAGAAIKLIKETFSNVLILAGTVISREQAEEAMNQGASAIISPGLDENLVEYCQEKGYPILPGIATASEIQLALSLNLQTVKFFPAEINGGVSAISALSAPFAKLKFMPTGGISASNVEDYLKLDNVICCGGSWMVNSTMIKNKEFDKIEQLSKEAKDVVKKIKGV